MSQLMLPFAEQHWDDPTWVARIWERIYACLCSAAEKIASQRDQLAALLKKAGAKARRQQGKGESNWDRIWRDVDTILRMLGHWMTGEYPLPWPSVLMLVVGLLYLVTPLDFIPDFVPGIGLLDDVAVLKFVVWQLRKIIDEFLEWESQRDPDRAA